MKQPLIEMAGRDISDWFEPRTTNTKLDLVMIYDNLMGIVRYHIPHVYIFTQLPPNQSAKWMMFNVESMSTHILHGLIFLNIAHATFSSCFTCFVS